jgi:hypothetical protein
VPDVDDNRTPVEHNIRGTAINGDEQAPPEEPSHPKMWQLIGRLKDQYQKVGWVTKLLVSAAGALATTLSIVAFFFPALQPTPPSSEAKANLSSPQVFPNVTLGEYIRQSRMPMKGAASSLSDEERQRLGNIVYFDVELKGFDGQLCYLRWSVYDADTKQPISGLTQQPAWPTTKLVAHHQKSKSRWETWVPMPREGRGPFLVNLEIYTNVGKQQVRLDATQVTIGT